MDNSATVHILDGVEHLMQEKSACVLPHWAHSLAEVKEETSLNELHDDVDEVVNDATAGLDDLAGISILIHVDNARVL